MVINITKTGQDLEMVVLDQKEFHVIYEILKKIKKEAVHDGNMGRYPESQ